MKRSAKFIILYIIVILVLAVIIQAYSHFSGVLLQTEILKYQNMEIGDDADCYFAREETVHIAPYAGQINYYLQEGTKVRKGTAILNLEHASKDSGKEDTRKYEDIMKRLVAVSATSDSLVSDVNGCIGYYIDGYENYFSPSNLVDLKYSDVSKLSIRLENLTRNDCLAGEPLFKIVNDSAWYILTWVKAESIGNYEVGKTVDVNFKNGSISATIDSITEDEEMWRVILKTSKYYEKFASSRRVRAKIVTQDYDGIKVKNSSIINENGKAGVYVRNKNGDIIFKPVKIYTSDGEYSVIAVGSFIDEKGKEVLTVDVYDDMLKNPKKEQGRKEGKE